MTDELRPKNVGTKKLFKSPILEKLSRTHISIPLTFFLIYSSSLLYWSITHTSLSSFLTVCMFVFGFISFTWVEYMAHRYLFHMSTPTKSKEKLQYTIHGVHHEFPKDKDRLAMPPILSITISTLLLLLFRLIMGDLAFSFLPGFLVGYTYYLSVHYMVPPTLEVWSAFQMGWVPTFRLRSMQESGTPTDFGRIPEEHPLILPDW